MSRSERQLQRRGTGRLNGFTLAEVLVVIGIAALLMSFLLSVISSVRDRGRELVCMSNMRQIAMAMRAYAEDHNGHFPPNTTSPAPARFWFHGDRLGKYLRHGLDGFHELAGPLVTCPNDDAGAVRSYSMNFWASGEVNSAIIPSPYGQLVRANSKESSRIFLLLEGWSHVGSEANGWKASAFVGLYGETPGRRFGAGPGIGQFPAGRFGYVTSELSFQRHRRSADAGSGTQPAGRLNFAYVDGHVEAKSHLDLVDQVNMISTLDSLWSPMDRDMNMP